MPYHTYQTEGVILEAFNSGENNRSLVVFTREFGLIRIYAKSSREVRSKLRPVLQKFSYVKFSVVRGKGSFRATGAEEKINLYYELTRSQGVGEQEGVAGAKMEMLIRIHSLLLRLLQGQERDEGLYDVVKTFTEYLRKGYNVDENSSAVELLTVARILYRLGHLREIEGLNKYFTGIEITGETINLFSKNYKQILNEVNKAIESSQL